MSFALLMDVHVQRAITDELRSREVDVKTAQELGFEQLEDSKLIEESFRLGRVVFARDDDFLRIAVSRQRTGLAFASVVYGHQLRVPIGQCIQDLEIIAKASPVEDARGQIFHLPLS